ncbi:MAG: glycosyltransferase family 1 protein [Syntrophomonadaceae bacterium]|nr:glycosyltransferase family 1 protein [Syntrophomonadaceae bacterium]
MRIAIFSDTYLPQINGVSKYLEEMLKQMDKNRIRYRLYVPATDQESSNITIFQGRTFWLYPELQISWPNQARIRRDLDEFQPDLIYLATQLSIGAAGLKYARYRNLPVVTTYHTNFPQYLGYYRWGFMQKPVWKYLQWFHSFSSLNFCPSLATLEELLLHGIGNVRINSNGIDCDLFTPAKRSESLHRKFAPQNQILLLYVGRVAPEKGLETLMQAVKLLNRAGLKFRLLIVGDGPARQALQDMAMANVVFCGYKSGRELQAIYASADIFVFPSATETFGNVVLEAMASGLPSVVANRGGATELLRDQHNGLTFRTGDAESMVNCVLKLVYDNDLCHQLGQNARAFALTRTWDKTFAGFFASCGKIISANHSEPSLSADKIA